MKSIGLTALTLIVLFALSACMPEPGSKAWCESIADKPKGQWTADDAGTYTKYCVLGNYKE